LELGEHVYYEPRITFHNKFGKLMHTRNMKTSNEGPEFCSIVGVDTNISIKYYEDFSRVVSKVTNIIDRSMIVFDRTIKIELDESGWGGETWGGGGDGRRVQIDGEKEKEGKEDIQREIRDFSCGGHLRSSRSHFSFSIVSSMSFFILFQMKVIR
jgi:hypothetical protein